MTITEKISLILIIGMINIYPDIETATLSTGEIIVIVVIFLLVCVAFLWGRQIEEKM